MRMPEQRHYREEILNRGYIYTNLRSIEVKKEEYNPNIIKHLKANRIPGYTPIEQESYYKARVDYGDVTASFAAVFEAVANKVFGITESSSIITNKKAIQERGVDLDIKRYEQEIIADTAIDAKSIDELSGTVKPDELAKLNVAVDELAVFFDQTIASNLGPFRNIKRSVPSIRSAIYQWFNKYLDAEDWSEPSFFTQKVFMDEQNRKIFEVILAKAIEKYKQVKEGEVRKWVEETEERYPYELPTEQFYNQHTDELVKVNGYAHEPCYLSIERSNPEREFETFLNTHHKKIAWWWKNGENKKDFFGVKYELNGTIFTFYPDYLVRLIDGSLGFLEVKDPGDRDGSTITKAKAEALHQYIAGRKDRRVFGGIVINRHHEWLLNNKARYDWEKCTRGDWGDWEALEL